MTNKKGRASRHSPKRYSQPDDSTKKTQRRRIADYLMRHTRATVLDLQTHCAAMHPPRRVHELRRDFGWRIDTRRGPSASTQYYALISAGSMP